MSCGLIGKGGGDRQRLVQQGCDFVVDLSPDRKPVQLVQYTRHVITSSGSGDEPCVGVLDRLNFPHEADRHTMQQ